MASGAVLDLNGFNETLGSLAGAGNVALGSGTLTAGGNNASTTYRARSRQRRLNKAGGGTLIFTGTNLYGRDQHQWRQAGDRRRDHQFVEREPECGRHPYRRRHGQSQHGDDRSERVHTRDSRRAGQFDDDCGNIAFQSGALYVVYVNQTTSSFAR